MQEVVKATPEQISELRQLVPGIDDILNIYQINTLAFHLDLTMGSIALRTHLRIMGQMNVVSEEALVNIVRHINMGRFEGLVDKSIELRGFIIHPVFNDDDPNGQFAYTEGLSLKTGYELIACGNADCRTFAEVLVYLADEAVEGKDILAADENRFPEDIRPFSVRLVKIDPKHVADKVTARRTKNPDIYQVVCTDPNGYFPEDERYNPEFVQATWWRTLN